MTAAFLTSVLAGVTLATAASLAAARVARRARAASRHAVLAAALLVSLVLPFGAAVAPTIHVSVPASADVRDQVGPATFDVSSAVSPAAREDLTPTNVVVTSPSVRRAAGAVGFAVWMAGLVFCLSPMLAGLRHMRSIRHGGRPWTPAQAALASLTLEVAIRRPVDVLIHDAIAGPVTCGVRRPVIVLSADATRWSTEGLLRALIHEIEHIRRFDWITQIVARVLCAVYWFHPLVWAVRRQLALEAERACDDAVLVHPAMTQIGADAAAYAEQLVELARRLSRGGRQPLLAMADRRDLSTRVRALLDSRQARGRAGAHLVAAAAAASVLIVVGVSPIRMVAAADPFQVTNDTPRFEAATIRPCQSAPAPGPGRGAGPGPTASAGRLHIECAPLVGDDGLIRMAFAKFGNGEVNKYWAFLPIANAPPWAASERFTIDAKASEERSAATMKGPMLQALLSDAFHLKTHRESRQMQVYNLGVAKSGSKLHAFDGSCTPIDFSKSIPPQLEATGSCVFVAKDSTWDAPGQTIDDFIKTAMSNLDRPVVNTTGIPGRFTIHLDLSAETGADRMVVMARALQQQLGLTLTPTAGSQDILVIDAVSRPDPTYVRGGVR